MEGGTPVASSLVVEDGRRRSPDDLDAGKMGSVLLFEPSIARPHARFGLMTRAYV